MNKKPRIIVLEDCAADYELLEHELRRAGLSAALQQVNNEADFLRALKEFPPDAVISDCALPGFSGLEALEAVKKQLPETPFIALSGTIGDEMAVELLKRGAADFISKQNLAKLPPAIKRAMNEAQERKEKRREEHSLRGSESRFRAIFEGAGTGIAVEDLQGRIVETNRALQQMLGYTAEELQAITRRDFTHAHDHKEDLELYNSLLSGKSNFYQKEKRFVRKDGRIIWGRLTVSMVRDDAGQPQFPLAMIEDITERQRAEEAHLQYAAIVEFSNDAIISTTFDGVIFSWNPAAERVYGYTAREANGRSISLIIPPEKEDEFTQILERIKHGERMDNFETTRVCKDGSIIYVSVTTSPIKDASGKIIGVSSISRDITSRKRAEEALRKSEAGLTRAQRIAHLGNWEWDLKTDAMMWSEELYRIFGLKAGEFGGSHEVFLEYLLPEDRQLLVQAEQATLKSHKSFSVDHRILTPEGQIKTVNQQAELLLDEKGKPLRLLGTVLDITQRKRAENRSAAFSKLGQRLSSATTSTDAARVIVEVADNLLGWDSCILDLCSPDAGVLNSVLSIDIVNGQRQDVPHVYNNSPPSPRLRKIIEEGAELILRQQAPKPGDFFPFGDTTRPSASLMYAPVRNGPVVIGVLSIQSYTPNAYTPDDLITLQALADHCGSALERIRAEEARRKSEASLTRAQRIAHLGNWEWDLKTDAMTWSVELYRIFGLKDGESGGTHQALLEYVFPEDRRLLMDAERESLASHKPFSLDHRILTPAGEIKTVNQQAEVVLDDKGKPLRLLGTLLDITQRKRAENRSAAFSELGQRLSSASTAAAAARIIVEVADDLLGWDSCRLDLCSADLGRLNSVISIDIVDGRRQDVAHIYNNTPPSPRVRKILEKGAELILRQDAPKPGDFIPFGDTGRPSASLLYVPVRNGPDVIGVLGIQSYTPNAYTPNDLITLQALADHCAGALERIRAESENQALAAFPQFNPNPVLELAADGSINYFNEAAQQMASALGKKHPAEFMPAETSVWVSECLASGESKLRHQTVIENRTISWSFFPVPAVGIVHCYAADITERQNLEAQLRQAQKMESVGQLAGGIAHDFNNILTVIQGHTSLLTMAGDLTTEGKESAQQIGLAAERAANLTRQLLTFSRRQIIQPKNLDLNEVVNNMTKMLRRLLGEDIILQVNYSTGLPLVHADPGMMEQILLNLSVNARDAMPRGGRLFVDTSVITVDKAYAEQHPETAPGQYICLAVKDTGTGMSPEVLPRIFEPFFTTKDVGKGTGLGLATVYGIVQQHRGWIKVASTVGQGTVFQIFLPAVAGKITAQDEQASGPRVRGGKETILLVEDEAPLRVLVRSVLERYGYHVLEAVSGVAALAVWEQHRDEIKLLLTDMVMPHGISGRELAVKLLAEKPDLKVIYSSGYSLAVVGTDMVLQEGINFLQKPYHPRKLAQAVRDCLDG